MKYQPETIEALKTEVARAVALVFEHASNAHADTQHGDITEDAVKQLGIVAVAANAAYTIASQIHASESQEHEFGIVPDEITPGTVKTLTYNTHETER